MEADINLPDLKNGLATVTKGVRGRLIQDRARALLIFRSTGVSLDFNDVVVNCWGHVSRTGSYSLNPFILRRLLDTYNNDVVRICISVHRFSIGTSQIDHGVIRGHLDDPDVDVQTWELDRQTRDVRKLERTRREVEKIEAEKIRSADRLANARHIAYRRTDGAIEYGASVLRYEKGEPGHRRVLVKTTDFLEGWINEVEIVSFGKDPELLDAE